MTASLLYLVYQTHSVRASHGVWDGWGIEEHTWRPRWGIEASNEINHTLLWMGGKCH